MRWIEVDPYIVDRARRVIAEVYDTKSKEKEETRSFQGLDRFRRREHPDDFGVAVYYEDKTKEPERLWVRISRVEGNQCFGTLLMDSKHPDGPKEGEEIMFKSSSERKRRARSCVSATITKDRAKGFH